MLRKSIQTLAFIASIATVKAQNCTPTSPITSSYPTTENALINVIKSNSKEYSSSEFDKLRAEIEACNNALKADAFTKQSAMSALSQKYLSVLRFKDVSGLQKQIEDLKKGKTKAEQELEQRLSDVKQTGFYIVLLKNLSGFINPQKYLETAKTAATPTVVNDLLGEKITRFSQVESYVLVKDKIKAFVAGEVKVDAVLVQKANNAAKYFVYAAKLSATPLKNSLSNNQGSEASNAIVFNPKIDTDWKARLRQEGVSDDYIGEIERVFNSNSNIIEQENSNQTDILDDLLKNSTANINEINDKIKKIEKDLKERGEKIQKLFKEMNIPYNSNSNIDQNIEQILAKIKQDIALKNKEWQQIIEQQIETRTPATITLDDEPEKTFAVRALEMCQQIQNQYSTIDKIQQITEIENLTVTKFDESRKISLYRQVQNFWVYLVPHSTTYEVYVFAKFKLTDNKVSNNPSSTNTNTSSYNTDFEQSLGTNNSIKMVFVQGGSFQMGSDNGESDEKPVHRVTLSDFYIGKTEVTQRQWRSVMGSDPPELAFKGCDDCPVERVSWNDVQDFLQKLNSKTGKNYRLPTEAEWEYAARGGNKSKGYTYSGSNTIDDVAWYGSNSDSKTHSVAGKDANELGIYDMSGNVWEWCSDWYKGYPGSSGVTDYTGSNRVLRGGSWDGYSSYCRVASRTCDTPVYRDNNLGFRLGLSVR
jgi:formylglycine-generating enzyme required for sulfatase activity